MRSFRLLASTVSAVCAMSAAVAQMPPGVQKGASVEGITEYTYPNGLRLLLFPDPSNPKVTVNVTYLVGSRHEGYGETGMAHLLEHLLFIRTTTNREIKKELTGHGASWNGSTSYDRTNYFETVTASDENLRWALSLEADRMVHSRMEKALLDPEMTVVRNEFERGENSPTNILEERVVSTAYLWHNYGKSTIGSRADIENVPIDRLAAFYRKYYQPDNAVLVIAGQFDESKAMAMVAETLGRIPKPERKLDPTYTLEPVQDGERYVALKRVGDGQAVMVAYHTPAAAHPDSAVLEVLSAIMSGVGRGVGEGRLYKALVDNKKAVSARMASEQLHDPGFVLVSAQLSKDQSLADARKIMIDVVEGFVKEPPTKEEVERAKSRLLRNIELGMTNSQSVGLNLSEWSAMGDWRLLFLNRDRIRSVTPEDVVRVAKTYLLESNRTVGEFIPTAQPVRAEIPVTPSLVDTFKNYKGGEAIAQGEVFNPTPANIESRLIRTKLANGMKVAILPRKTRGATVNATLELHFGDEKSLAGQAAVAEITGALLMRGTKNKDRQQLQDEMDRLKTRIVVSAGGGGGGPARRGAPVASSTAADAVASIETTAENLAGALKLAVEVLREPGFPETEFEQVKQQRIAALENNRTEPQAIASLEMQRRLNPFPRGDVRYVGTLDEQIAELKKVTLQDVVEFHKKFYGAANGELVILGPVEQAMVTKTAGELLGAWNSSAPYKRLDQPYKSFSSGNIKVETPDKQNAYFEAAVRVQMSEDDPDYAAMLLANSMFGGSLGARMPNRIRNVEGLSYSVASRFAVPGYGDGSLFTGIAISAPQNTPKVEASFKDELDKTLKSGFTPEEVTTAKQAYHNQMTVARSQEALLVRTIAARERKGKTMKWDQDLEARIDALTPEQINTAFRKHLDASGLTIVKAGDFRKAGVYAD